jgi:hypothetical protein
VAGQGGSTGIGPQSTGWQDKMKGFPESASRMGDTGTGTEVGLAPESEAAVYYGVLA